jgi:hypothetical protein
MRRGCNTKEDWMRRSDPASARRRAFSCARRSQAKVALLGGVTRRANGPIGELRLGGMCAVRGGPRRRVLGGSVGALDGSTVRHRQTYKRAGREGMAEGKEVATCGVESVQMMNVILPI